MNHKQESNNTQPDAVPVIVWEQRTESKPASSETNIIPMADYRRKGTNVRVEFEAAVTVRSISTGQVTEADDNVVTTPPGEPIRLIMVSSGFGQRTFTPANNFTLQSKAA